MEYNVVHLLFICVSLYVRRAMKCAATLPKEKLHRMCGSTEGFLIVLMCLCLVRVNLTGHRAKWAGVCDGRMLMDHIWCLNEHFYKLDRLRSCF